MKDTPIQQLNPKTLAVVRERIGGDPSTWDCAEFGDGNVNLIFRVVGPKGPVLLKQAVPYLRCVGAEWPLSMKRNFYEYKTLHAHSQFAAEYLPAVYAYDEESSAMVMEFLGNHVILRKGMMNGLTYENFSGHISDYMARTLFFTSDLALPAAKKKEMMELYCGNTDLCKITEDLIFTEPYYGAKLNKWTPALAGIVDEFQKDVALKVAATELRAKFLTSTEALIHGDLHSGSIMVNENETKVIDPEFGFFGPMAFDPGLLIGNFLMSVFAQGAVSDAKARTYEAWILKQIVEIWTEFDRKFSALWETNLTGDHLSKVLATDKKLLSEVRSRFMRRLFEDSLGFAGTEMIRRILGLAKVADLETIADLKVKAACETKSLRMARELMVNSKTIRDIEGVAELAKRMQSGSAR